jgi:3-hydroxyisobutyrate dehydrogenase-like beta-hydroxyacid dehydrogenase
MSECGFIGLGRMGGAMARRLIGAGHRVVAFDLSQPARDALAAEGAIIGSSARAVADVAPIVFLSLPSPQIVVDTMLGPDAASAGNRL